jgi:Na+/H+-dicarboxylate symporter
MMKALRTYGFSLLLVGSICVGFALGVVSPAAAAALRPIGDLYLNLIFMIIVPLVFFTIASSIAAAPSAKRLTQLGGKMLVVFLATSVVAAVGALAVMLVVQPTPGAGIHLAAPPLAHAAGPLAQIVDTFTTSDFPQLISRKAMLPLIVFSIAVGVATLQAGERAAAFAAVLHGGSAVFLRLVDYVMYVAPVGLMAWFAATVVDTGAQLADAYLGVFVVYYAFGTAYFALGFSAFAYVAGGRPGVARFWRHMLRPSLTALGTCSSMATMPCNLEAARGIGIPAPVVDLVVPIAAAVHKDGSVIGGVLKVLFAMSVVDQPLTAGGLFAVVGIAILVGVVMGAIPSGGMMGELLIVSVLGLPASVLPLLAIISIIIDPLATLLNATGDSVAAMLVARWTDGDLWRRPSHEVAGV